MKITCLAENTSHTEGIGAEHGLSLFIETEKNNILFDTGQTGLFAENAEKLGISLDTVNMVFISHGHYDHTGGLLRFVDINKTAPVYIHKKAFEAHWHTYDDGTPPRYIGISGVVSDDPRLILTYKTEELSDGIYTLTDVKGDRCCPATNSCLSVSSDEGYSADDFSHEQSLVIRENGRYILVCGCAHKGIINILDKFYEQFGCEPYAVIGGFHTMRKSGLNDRDKAVIKDISAELDKMTADFYTCHCTGEEAAALFAAYTDDKVKYISAGDSIYI